MYQSIKLTDLSVTKELTVVTGEIDHLQIWHILLGRVSEKYQILISEIAGNKIKNKFKYNLTVLKMILE